MWFLYRLAPGSAFYDVPIAVPFRGVIDKAAMQRTVQEFVARHEILRTTYNEPEPGSPVQVIGRMPAIEVPVSDLRGLDEQTREAEHQAAAQRLYEEPFDLERGPVLRARLIRLADRRAVLHLIVHHIAIDHWGINITQTELRAIYRALVAGRPSPLPPPPLQYADFATEQLVSETRTEAQLAYWRRRLDGAPPVLDLPSDRSRPAV